MAEAHAAGSTTTGLQCVIVTPERAVLDQACDFVALPMFDGELGVLPGRVPMIGRLGFGELRTGQGTRAQRYYIDGGFVQIHGNVVTVLTPKALKADEIKVAAVEASMQALKAVATDDAIDAQLKSLDRARAQLRVAKKAADDHA